MSIIAKLFEIDDMLKDKSCNSVRIDGVDIVSDVVYNEACPDVCRADLFIPTGKTGKLRALINIHGGGWISGDKKWRKGFCSLMCDNQTFIMNINYGLSPTFTYPECIRHTYAAIAWLHANANLYNIDLGFIYLSGDSAGAQIASFSAAIYNNPSMQQYVGVTRPDCDIYGLILFCGAYDMIKTFRLPVSSKICLEITGKRPSHLGEFEHYKALNTYHYIDDTFPRTLLVSASMDVMVKGQGDILELFLINHSIPYAHFTSKSVVSSDHCFHLKHYLKESQTCLSLAKDFLQGNMLCDDTDGTGNTFTIGGDNCDSAAEGSTAKDA